MGDLAKGFTKAVGSVAKMWGVKPERRHSLQAAPSLPDDSTVELEAKRKRARAALRSGRVSTILDDDEDSLG